MSELRTGEDRSRIRRLAWRFAAMSFLAHAAFVTAALIPGWRAEPLTVGDSITYVQSAEAMVKHGAFTREAAPPFRWEPHRTPGYPAVIAASLAITGDYRYALYASCVTAAMAALACVWLAFEWGGVRAAPAAGWLAVLLPNSLGLSGFLLTDAMAGHLTVVWIWLLYVGMKSGGRATLAGSAGVLFALQMLKPTFNLAIVLIPFAAWHAGMRRRIVPAVTLCALGLIAPLFLSSQNYKSHGVFAPTLLSAEALRLYTQADYVARATGRTHSEVFSQMAMEDSQAARTMSGGFSDDGRLYLVRRREVRRFVSEHPVAVVGMMAVEAGRQLFAPHHFPFMVFSTWRPLAVRIAGAAITALLIAFAGLACVRLSRAGLLAPVILVAACVAFFLVSGSVSRFVGARLRFPADMVMLPLVGVGVSLLSERLARRNPAAATRA